MSAKNELAKLYKDGLEVRRDVLGTEYVDGSIAKANDFTMAFQHITTEMCWGYAWTRPGLSRKTRSMLNLAMLTALNRSAEIKLHVKGALTNGVTVEEIKEVIDMLVQAKKISLDATIAANRLKGLKAFEREGVPELLRQQFQIANSLCVQAEKIWTILLMERQNGR